MNTTNKSLLKMNFEEVSRHLAASWNLDVDTIHDMRGIFPGMGMMLGIPTGKYSWKVYQVTADNIAYYDEVM